MLLHSCETVVVEPGQSYRSYFPLEAGAVWEYQIDSISYRETIDNDTSRWWVREEILEISNDLEGSPSAVIQRSQRSDSTSSWNISGTWTAKLSESQAERVENNLRFITMTFPVREGKVWSGHAFLSDLASIPVSENCNNWSFLENWQFEYQNVHSPYLLEGVNFDSTATVIQQGENNLIERNYSEAVYANGVGLIYRKFEHLTTQTICEACPWNEKAECGFLYEQRLLSWSE